MENCRYGSTFFAQGEVGGIESIGSTILLSSAMPSMQNYTIGSTYDQPRNRFLWFNWSSIGAHQIKCYEADSGLTYVVLHNSQLTGGLGFDKNRLIHSCYVENGCLYWTDNIAPRRINIDAAIKMNYPGYVTDTPAYTSPLSQAVIAWIRRPPGLPPSQTKQTQTVPAVVGNSIDNEAFMFCYRYQFKTYEYSTLSADSLLANFNRPTDTYNCIDITIPLGEKIEQDVLQVDLVAKYLVGGKFFIIKSWNKNIAAQAVEITAHNAGAVALVYRFFNDQTGRVLDDAYATKPYDNVPREAQTAALAGNRSFLGGNLLGYDTPLVTSLSAETVSGSISPTVFKTNAPYEVSVTFYDDYQRKTGYITRKEARVNIPDRLYGTTNFVSGILWSLSNTNALAEIPLDAASYSINITKCFRTRFFLQLRGKGASYVSKDINGDYVFNYSQYQTNYIGCAFDISTLDRFGMGYVFSEGDIIKIWIAGNPYVQSTAFSLAITAQDGNNVITELANLDLLNGGTLFLFEIYTPYRPTAEEPSYEVYQIYKVANPDTAMRQYTTLSGIIAGDVTVVSRYGDNVVQYTLPEDNTPPETDDEFFTVACDYYGQTAPDSLFATGNSPLADLSAYNPVTNNTRWILKSFATPLSIRIYGSITVNAGNKDRSFVLYVEDSNIPVNRVDLFAPTAILANETKTFFFNQEFTLKENSRLFILCGVGDNGLFHQFYFKTSYLNIAVASTTVTYSAEAMSPNDKFYKNWFTNAGRPNFIDTIGAVLKKGGIAYSNTLIEGSKVNGLSTFDALDQRDLDSQMGALQKLQLTSKVQDQQGAVMLAICQKETASMYLGEVQVVASSQNAFLASSPNVIGTINILKGSFGTLNPESVLEYKGLVFWVDVNNGKVIQYGGNGLFAISSYKVTKFWKLFSQTYASLSASEIEAFGSRPFIFTGIDPNSGEVLFSIPKVLANPPKGYLPDMPDVPYPFDIWDGRAKSMIYNLYAEPNHWQGSFNIPAEGFVYGGNTLYSFKDGGFFQHGYEYDFNNFYGIQNKARIMYLCNTLPNKPKALNNISLEANKRPSLTYFRTEIPYIQASNLMDFDWEDKEGQLYAAVYNNIQTPSATGLVPNGLINGEKMRSIVHMILMEFDVSGFSGGIPLEFRFATLGYSISLGHTT